MAHNRTEALSWGRFLAKKGGRRRLGLALGEVDFQQNRVPPLVTAAEVLEGLGRKPQRNVPEEEK